MNKLISVSAISAILIIAVLAITAMPSKASAKKECFTQYGGGETCIDIDEDGKLDVDKTVWNPESDDFEDNIKASEHKFSEGNKVRFRIRVKNTGDIRLENIELEDVLPSFVRYSSGDGDGKSDNTRVEFDEFDLNPGESEEFEFTAKVDFDGVSPKDSTVCLTNVARAEGEHKDDEDETESDSDFANFCVKTGKVLGKESPKRMPVTGGSEDQTMANLILAGAISSGLILVGFGLKKIAN